MTHFSRTYTESVKKHLDNWGHRGRLPSPREMAAARNQGISPRRYSRWFMRQRDAKR